MHALHAQPYRFRWQVVRPLLSLALVGCLCLLAAALAPTTSRSTSTLIPLAPITLRSTLIPTAASSPTPSQDVVVHLAVQRQTGHLASGTITLYVTLTLTNARSAQISLFSSCFGFSLMNTQGGLLWGSANPCISSNYDFTEVQPGQTYTIEKDMALVITRTKGLEAGTYVLVVGDLQWHDGPSVPRTPIAGVQGDASGQTSVELS